MQSFKQYYDKPDIDMVSKAIIYREGYILMLQKAKGWELPGGHLQEGESFKEGLYREVFEETGLDVHNEKSVGGDEHFALFLITNFTGKVRLSKEHKKFKWFKLKQLPKNKLTPATNRTLPEISKAILSIQ